MCQKTVKIGWQQTKLLQKLLGLLFLAHPVIFAVLRKILQSKNSVFNRGILQLCHKCLQIITIDRKTALQTVIIPVYTGWAKKVSLIIFAITLSTASQFSR